MVSPKLLEALKAQRGPREPLPKARDHQRTPPNKIAAALRAQDARRDAEQQAERAAQEALAASRFRVRPYGPGPFTPISEAEFLRMGEPIRTDALTGGRQLHMVWDGRLTEVMEHPVEGGDQ